MMEVATDTIVIERSRIKIAALFVGSAVMVSLGIWLWLKPHDAVSAQIAEPATVRVVGLISVAIFGIAGLFILKALTNKRPAIIINAEGVTDYVNALSPGFIAWEDITAVEEIIIKNQPYISIKLNNVQQYINSQKSARKRNALQHHFNQTGAIINISANGLQCHYHQLKNIVIDAFNQHKANHPS